MDNRSLLKIKEISIKIDKLTETNANLVSDNKRLIEERERLIEERVKHTKLIGSLREELNVLKFTYNMVGGSKEKARNRIKTIIREIDVCISLISKWSTDGKSENKYTD